MGFRIFTERDRGLLERWLEDGMENGEARRLRIEKIRGGL